MLLKSLHRSEGVAIHSFILDRLMDEKPRNDYSNRELETNFMVIHEKIKELGNEMKETLNEIRVDVKATREQVTKTNGRVNELEWWRKAVVWGLGLLWVIITGIAPMLYYFGKNEISRIVEDTLQRITIQCNGDNQCDAVIQKKYDTK